MITHWDEVEGARRHEGHIAATWFSLTGASSVTVGVQLIRVLRKVTPGVPILGLTGHVGRGYMAQASSHGVTCLSKPIPIDDLLTDIRDVLAAPRAV